MTELMPMSESERATEGDDPVDEAELAAAAFLARYQGRTLDAYRDLPAILPVGGRRPPDILKATRPQIELYVRAMEACGLAATTIDRRLSTVCGFYRFAHIDGRIASNPAQYVRRPKVHPNDARGLDRAELGAFLFAAERVDHAHAALAVLLGLNGLQVTRRARPTSRTSVSSGATASCASSARATSRRSSRWCRGRPAPSTWPSASGRLARSCSATTAVASTGAPPTAGCARSPSVPESARSTRTCCGRRSSCAFSADRWVSPTVPMDGLPST
jgi:hypothetical protein